MERKSRGSKVSEILNTTQGKTYTVAIVTIFVVILMIALAIVPAYLSISNELVQNEAKRVYLDELEAKEQLLNKLAQQETKYDEEIKLLERLFTEKSNDEYIYANISQIAERYNCTVKSISFDDDKRNLEKSKLDQFPNLQRKEIGLTLSGGLSGLQLFISHLEAFPTTVMINSMRYKLDIPRGLSQQEISTLNDYELSLSGEYFFWDMEDK